MHKLNTGKYDDQNDNFDNANLESLLVQHMYSAITSSVGSTRFAQIPGANPDNIPDTVRYVSEQSQQRIKELRPAMARLDAEAQQFRKDPAARMRNCLNSRDHALLAMLWTLLHSHCWQVGYDDHFLTLVKSTWVEGLVSKDWSARLLDLYRKTLLLWDLELGWHTAFVTNSLHNDPSVSWFKWQEAAQEVGTILRSMHAEVRGHGCTCSDCPWW